MDEPWYWNTALDPQHDDGINERWVRALYSMARVVEEGVRCLGQWAQAAAQAVVKSGLLKFDTETWTSNQIKTEADRRLFHQETMKLAVSEAKLRLLGHRNPKQCKRRGRQLRRLNSKAYRLAMREQFGSHRGV